MPQVALIFSLVHLNNDNLYDNAPSELKDWGIVISF